MSDDCIFCRIANGEIPAAFLAETDDAVVFMDIKAEAPIHALVVPRTHVESLAAASDDALLGRLLALAARVAREQGIEESGYRVVINTNADGGQTIGHLHLHILGGRHLTWPPG